MTDREKLLTEIDAFLSRSGMSQSNFGYIAVNDGKFIPRIRRGGRFWPETAIKVRDCIAKRDAALAKKKQKVTAT